MLKNIISNSNNTNNKEYLQNQMQIDCISRLLVEHADVPQQLINWLIEAVRDNTKIECNNKTDIS